jgi:2-polyprenyl-6-methoxyphenol hydroxylase-like FAD-dependent oxidoreductase
MTSSNYDVAVIGGGPAGSATALLLARSGLSVLLLEASGYRAPRVGEALSPQVGPRLVQLGVGGFPNPDMHLAAQGIVSMWGSREPRVNDYLFGLNGAGWHVDRAMFDRMLAQNARKAGATVRRGSQLLSPPLLTGKHWVFEFARKGQRFACSCRFLVDATGRSGTPWLAHLSHRVVLDRLVAVVWTGKSHSNSQYLAVESVTDGWFYSANLPQKQTTIAYMTDSDLYRKSRQRTPSLWRWQLDQTTYARQRLAVDADLSKLRIVSAATVIRAQPAGEHWCAVGDAAFSQDPLSGLGVPHALESAGHAASAIKAFLERGELLNSYKSWITRRIQTYLICRAQYYASECRWRSSPFWERRTPQTFADSSAPGNSSRFASL